MMATVKARIDIHVHTRFSADSIADPEDIIAVAKARGLSGFAVTDHNTSECAEYLESVGLMNPSGEAVDGFLIIPGQEITTCAGHLLAIGCSLPSDLKGIPPEEAIELIHRHGGLAIPPHPYDFFRAGIREPILEELPIDALEVFNAATTLRRYNTHARHYAEKRGIPMTAASDAHHPEAVGTAHLIVEVPSLTVAHVLEAIRRGAELHQAYLTPKEALKKTWNNWMRFGKRQSHRPELAQFEARKKSQADSADQPV